MMWCVLCGMCDACDACEHVVVLVCASCVCGSCVWLGSCVGVGGVCVRGWCGVRVVWCVCVVVGVWLCLVFGVVCV